MHPLEALSTPPDMPQETFRSDNYELQNIGTWDRIYASTVLAGLSTDAKYHANQIRLDWLLRLTLSNSCGTDKPNSRDFLRVLNQGLEEAGILRLEDPIEHFFCEHIATIGGNFRVFPGQWEFARPCTETMIIAFQKLPDSYLKAGTLNATFALLTLSEEIAKRADSDNTANRNRESPASIIDLDDSTISRDLRRVVFSPLDLANLRINKFDLAPFILNAQQQESVSKSVVGNSPLEICPLIEGLDNSLIVNVTTISTAVRAIIIENVINQDLEQLFLSLLMQEQEQYTYPSRFWPTQDLELTKMDRRITRYQTHEIEAGRYLQIIQAMPSLEGFPTRAFGSSRSLNPTTRSAITEEIEKFWRFLKHADSDSQGVTVVLVSSWESQVLHQIHIDESMRPPEGWRCCILHFSEVEVLGGCEGASLDDIMRIQDQVRLLERQNISFINYSGILNLFEFWRHTNGEMVNDETDVFELCEPSPFVICLPTMLLLEPKQEAALIRDRRSLPFANGTHKFVQRLSDSSSDGDPESIYLSIDDVKNRCLIGAVSIAMHTWWIEVVEHDGHSREILYRIFDAVLHWLHQVFPRAIEGFPDSFPARPVLVRLTFENVPTLSRSLPDMSKPINIEDTVTVSRDSTGRPIIHVHAAWFQFLRESANIAELELAASVLEGFAESESRIRSRQQLRAVVRSSVPSPDWRWIHAEQISIPTDALSAAGMIGEFRAIRPSAMSLVRCGLVWEVHPRSRGSKILGTNCCVLLLKRLIENIQGKLVAAIQKLNREDVLAMVSRAHQNSRAEQWNWRRTIRALRESDKSNADARALKRQTEINTVIRASKVFCEIAVCEARQVGGNPPRWSEIEEILALIIVLVRHRQVLSLIRNELISADLQLTPSGDVMSTESFSYEVLRPTAEIEFEKVLNAEAERYEQTRDEDARLGASDRRTPDELDAVIRNEYGVSFDVFVKLPADLVQLALQRQESIFVIGTSELASSVATMNPSCAVGLNTLIRRLTLNRRPSWAGPASGFGDTEIDVGLLDRHYSVINRPLIALDSGAESRLLVSPTMVEDAIVYALDGLRNGSLPDRYWSSDEAIRYSGAQGQRRGQAFEHRVASKILERDLEVWQGKKLSWLLQRHVDERLGEIDVLVLNRNENRLWLIEAKDLKLRRSIFEIALRWAEFRGQMKTRGKRTKPDSMLRHIQRVRYIREHRDKVRPRLGLQLEPLVQGLLVVSCAQPMNFLSINGLQDAGVVQFEDLGGFPF